MGLEPTTFCMASGSWDESFTAPRRMVERQTADDSTSRRSADKARFGAIPWGLGTGSPMPEQPRLNVQRADNASTRLSRSLAGSTLGLRVAHGRAD
jgi:hypothetical protein